MNRRHRKHTIAAGMAAIAAIAGGGAAVAASGSSTPQQESQTVVNDAAKQLGISSSSLSAALKKALENRVDAAVAAGRMTAAQGEALKAQIESGQVPLIGIGHGGPGQGRGHRADLATAASYLGMTQAELRTALTGGKTLADVAEAEGKSASGLVDALVAAATKRIDADVTAGRLTQAQADTLLANLEQRITDLVNGVAPAGGEGPFGPPPAAVTA